MKTKLLFKTFFLLASCSLSCLLVAARARAQPACREIPATPPIGTTCLDIQRIHARGDNSTDSFRSTYPLGWVIVNVQPNVVTRYGNTDGPHIRFYDAGTRLGTYEALNSAVQELENLRARAEGTDPNSGQSNAYEYINQQLSEFRNNRDQVASVNTNRAQLEATVSASRRCTGRTPLGCVDWQGGSFGVDLYIYRQYLGTPVQVSSQLNAVRETALSLIGSSSTQPQTSTSSRCEQEGNIEVRVGSSNLDFRPGQRWVTCTGYTFIFQSDGNLAHYNPSGQAIWATNTHDQGAEVLAMQADGNLVIYGSGGRIFWASNTHNNPGAFLAIQQDGNVVIYNNRGQALWATGTNGR